MKSIREYKTPTIFSMVFIVLECLIEIFIPFVTRNLINDIDAGIFDNIYQYGLILVILALCSLTCGVLAGRFCAKASVGFAKNLREDLFTKVQTFSFENIDKFSTSSLVTRMTTDIQFVQFSYMMLIRTAIRCPLMLILSATMAFVVGGAMGLLFVVITPLLAFALILIAKLAMPLFDHVFEKYDKLNDSVQENVNGIRVVKSYVREDYENEKFVNASNQLYKDFVKAERLVALNNPIMMASMFLVSLVICSFGSVVAIKEIGIFHLDIGSLQNLLTYGIQLLTSLMMFSMVFVIVSISIASAKRISEVLAEEPTIQNPENPLYTVEDGSIEFKNVNFKYFKDAAKNSLSDINLKIPSGSTVGIIGGTGSSKTTLIQLISRIYDTTEGEVLVGNKNVKEYDLDTLRNNVGVVLQKNSLFSGTIIDNLKWGDENATMEEMMEACEIAQANEYISSFPNKYEKVIERGGTNVSGGQKQRLCIARALLKKPKIIIFDDSTSAVDTKTDSLIRKGLENSIPNTTKIIIAQRIASIKDCDMIIVMDGGTINQVGTHDELLNTNKIYQEVYETQNQLGGGISE